MDNDKKVFEVVVTEKDENGNPKRILFDDKVIAGGTMTAGMTAFEKVKAEHGNLSLDDMDIKVRPF